MVRVYRMSRVSRGLGYPEGCIPSPPFPSTATTAVGMHPTGMLSCFSFLMVTNTCVQKLSVTTTMTCSVPILSSSDSEHYLHHHSTFNKVGAAADLHNL